MILVAGGTGRLGKVLGPVLRANGSEVRVLTRDRERARGLEGVEVVVGDVRDPATLDAAVDGAEVVVSAVHGFAGPGRVTPASVDRAGNAHLVDAARRAGADVVLLSVVGATPDSPMELFRAKYDAEQHLRASGAAWTIVRSTAFVELWAEIMARPVVLGRGENPINFVAVADVAAVVADAVGDRSRRGQVLEVGGPDDLTFSQFAALLLESGVAKGEVRHVPRGVLQAMAVVSRRARAAVVMDTDDMTFDSESRGARPAGRAPTPARLALDQLRAATAAAS
jgi:NADH dehydrogenase